MESSDADAARLSLALDAARLGDWSWDAATDVVTFSPRAAAIFQIPPGPHMTWTAMRGLLHPDDAQRAGDAVQQSIATRTDYDIEYRLVNGTGERWVSATGRALYADDGGVMGMLGVVQDITEVVRTRETLRAQAETLSVLNRMGRVLSAELDLQKVIQNVTDAATELAAAEFGAFFYNVLDDQGASYMLYTLSGVDRAHFERFPMPRATALFGPTFRGEGIIRLDDVRTDPRFGRNAPYDGMPAGHLPVVSYLAVPVIGRSGEVVGGLFFGHSQAGVFTERSEQYVVGLASQAAIAIDNARLYEAATRARGAAEAASRLKDEFLATLSHELRTPLNVIAGRARMLTGAARDLPAIAATAAAIDRNCATLTRLVDDLLDVSRMTIGQIRLDRQPTALAQIVAAAIQAVQPAADAKGVAIVSSGDPAAVVLADAMRLQQVVWNLLTNAIKFTPEGGRVDVESHVVSDGVTVVVRDSGQGIPADALPRVFDMFWQGEPLGSRQHAGLGLGLSIVRKLTELHGGQVTASSDGPGRGATFTIALPLATTAAVGAPPPRHTSSGDAAMSSPSLHSGE